MKYHYWVGAALLLCNSALLADQTAAMQELNHLLPTAVTSTLNTCTDPNPPCPAGAGCSGRPANVCADGRVQCLPSETCCSVPIPGQAIPYDQCVSNSQGSISDCCVVQGAACLNGSLCQYTQDAQGNKALVGCSANPAPACPTPPSHIG